MYKILILVFLFACTTNNVEPVVDIVENENVETQSRAIHLAQKHLAIRNYGWAEVSRVIENPESYRVEFETPVQERRLLGMRALTVSKDNGLVSSVKRR